jgi:hypothetical protein
MNNYLSDWKSGAAIATAVAVGAYTVHRSRSRTETPVTKLRGPPRYVTGQFFSLFRSLTANRVRDNLIMGQTKAILGAPGARKVLEEWADEYGGMFFRPGPFGSGDICVTDPKAVAHILGSSQVSFSLCLQYSEHPTNGSMRYRSGMSALLPVFS